ncbi:MAG TPA: hypothetical protein VFZ57_05465 [Thermoanaerobaculia bacterium]|nr:hypothetical protein [Thermoanaerobaculia bacterium]
MQILTYPVGVVVGLLPIVVELGLPTRPASLLLDGRQVCSLTAREAGCSVDLGPAPRVHLLEAVRRDESARVLERAIRWVNRPGAAQAEVQTRTRCPENTGDCDVTIGWAHPDRLDPKSVRVTLDGRRVTLGPERRVRLPARALRGSLLTVDLAFGDGRRATYAGAVGGGVRGDEESALTASLVTEACEPLDLDSVRRRLEKEGRAVRSVERGEWEVVFVAEPAAYMALRDLAQAAPPEAPGKLGKPFRGALGVTAIVANGDLERFDLTGRDGEGVLEGLLDGLWASKLRPVRTADAVAVSALLAGAAGHRRAVVLLLAGPADESALDAAGVRRYLDEVGVPLLVFRARGVSRPEWPDGTRIASLPDLGAALAGVKKKLDCQAVAWLEGGDPPR